MNITVETLTIEPGEVVIFTLDIPDLPDNQVRQLIKEFKETDINVQQVLAAGNHVMVKTNRVQVEKLTLDPTDRVVFYVDVGNMPPTKAKEYLEYVREQFASAVPSNQTLVLPNSARVDVARKETKQ